MPSLIPRYERGLTTSTSNLSGASGDSNRTHTLTYDNYVPGTITITLGGSYQYEGTDFTVVGQVLTFLNPVDDGWLWDMDYLVFSDSGTGLSSGSTLRYASVLQLAKILGLKKDSFSYEVGVTPTKESMNTSTTTAGQTIYFDHRKVLSGSYTLYYGSNEATALPLTETTHYTVDLTKGSATLTTAGAILIGSNTIWGVYSYISEEVDYTNGDLQEVLLRAEDEVDSDTQSTFTDGTATNPAYPLQVETHASNGLFDKRYLTKKRPLIDLQTTLASGISSSATSLDVDTGTGDLFPTTGFLSIGNEIIAYTGITNDTFTGLVRGYDGSTAAAHSAADPIHSTTIQVSGTLEGSTPTWTALSHESEAFVKDIGEVVLYNPENIETLFITTVVHPRPGVENRIKLRYLNGFDTVPHDINRLTLIYAKRMLNADNITGSMIKGRNEFKPEMYDVDEKEINRILSEYTMIQADKV